MWWFDLVVWKCRDAPSNPLTVHHQKGDWSCSEPERSSHSYVISTDGTILPVLRCYESFLSSGWTKHKPGHLGERSPKLTRFPWFSGLQRLPKAQETRTATVGQNGSKHTQPLYGYDEKEVMQVLGLRQVEQSSHAYTIIHTYDSRFCWFEWINFESTLWISVDRFTSGMTRIYLYPIFHSTESHA